MPVMLGLTQDIRDGRRTAFLVPTALGDRYQAAPDGDWRAGDDGFEHERPIHSVDHFGHTTHTVGETTSIKSIMDQQTVEVLVTSIRMVECARLTDDDLHTMGYRSRGDYLRQFGDMIQDRSGWYVEFILVQQDDLPAS
jgi:hypothetical protein